MSILHGVNMLSKFFKYFSHKPVISKIIEKNTIISGWSGSGKSTLLYEICHHLYSKQKSYLFLVDSLKSLNLILNQHQEHEQPFIFLLNFDENKEEKYISHSICINYLMLNQSFVSNFIIDSNKSSIFNKYIEILKSHDFNWNNFFNYIEKDPLYESFNVNFFDVVHDLFKQNILSEDGDINLISLKDINPLNCYILPYSYQDNFTYFKINFLINALQFILSQKKNQFYSILDEFTPYDRFNFYYEKFGIYIKTCQFFIDIKPKDNCNTLTHHVVMKQMCFNNEFIHQYNDLIKSLQIGQFFLISSFAKFKSLIYSQSQSYIFSSPREVLNLYIKNDKRDLFHKLKHQINKKDCDKTGKRGKI